MIRPRRSGIALLAALLVITAGTLFLGVRFSDVSMIVLPAYESKYPRKVASNSDTKFGGTSTIAIKESNSSVHFEFTLSDERQFPWVAFTITFDGFTSPQNYLDWSSYDSLSFTITCSPSNMLSVSVYAFDERITDPADFSSFRNPSAFFKCSEDRQQIKIELEDLRIPNWWLLEHNLPLSEQRYRLDKVMGLAIHNSFQSPRETLSSVTVHTMTLSGRDWRYIYLPALFWSACWGGILSWAARRYANARIERIKEETRKSQGFIPYQQLPRATRQERTKDALMSYIAKAYADPELSIETVSSALGLSRAKINEMLKQEHGLTFSGYLNKLRLTEAARLLREKSASVAEISCTVGYNNTSYFITIFKKEYGCTPNAFRKNITESSDV